MSKRSKSSNRWLQEHFSDPYVKQAQAQGYRSRAVFKLLEIQKKDPLIKPGMRVVDLGAAPGGWSQMAAQWVGKNGMVIALDRLPIEPITGVQVIQGDFTEAPVLQQLMECLSGKPVDTVMSDMAPNMSGLADVDVPRAMYLAELALDFAIHHLAKGGSFITKLFQGEGFDQYLQSVRPQFGKVVIRKPKASRPRSKEVYLVAKDFKGK